MEIEQDIRYKDGKIYKIVCNTTDEMYIGSTIKTLKERLTQHKVDNNSCISRNIIVRDNYKIDLIKEYPCNSKYELEEEERKYILENKCINITIPHRTKEEYYENNKDKILEQNKEWRDNNKEEILKQKKEYYENNKKTILEKNKEYRKINKEKIKEYRKNNEEKIREKKSEQIKCECGCMISRGVLAKHRRTKKHIDLMKCIIID